MKLLMILILVGLCTYVGYGFSRYYVRRYDFFKEFGLFLGKVSLDINFSRQKLAVIVQEYVSSSHELEKLLKNFLRCLDGRNIEEEVLFEGIHLLKEEEKPVFQKFFASLGHFDVENQTKQIEGFGKLFENWQKNAEQEKTKYAPLFMKLGLIVGVMISLILL